MHYIILILSLLLCAQPTQAGERLNIALIAVNGDKSATGNVSTYVQTLLEEELGKSGKFDLVERNRVKEVVEEVAFQQSGLTDQGSAVEIGKHLNVDQLIFVQTHRIYPDYELTLKVVDVASNRILRVEKTSLGQKTPEIRTAVRKLARRLIALSSLFSSVEMAFIPSGTFLMGSDRGLADERPPHRISINTFYLDRYEVTHIAFQEFLVTQGKKKRADLKDPDHPATMVSWTEASAYCRAQGKRLPTEAEWEYAARGDQNRAYPWGKATPSLALARFQTRGTLPADSLPAGATPDGVHHLAGNVAEWVQDWYDPGYYAASPAANPTGPPAGDYRVARGGSWNQLADEIRPTARAYHNPDKGTGDIGFRCASDAPPAP